MPLHDLWYSCSIGDVPDNDDVVELTPDEPKLDGVMKYLFHVPDGLLEDNRGRWGDLCQITHEVFA